MITLIFAFFYFFSFSELKSNTTGNTYSKLEIVPASKLIKHKEEYLFGIKINLEEGWKTYWKNPGEAGAKIDIKWQKDSNISEMEVLFPFPEKFLDHQVETIGYEKEIIFPVKIKPKQNAQSINTDLTIEYLICKEICIPITEKKKINFLFNDFILDTSKNEVIKYLNKVPIRDSKTFQIIEIFEKTDNRVRLTLRPVDSKKKNYKIFTYSEETDVYVLSINPESKINIDLEIDKKISLMKNPFFVSISDGINFEEISVFPDQIKANSNFFYYLLLAFVGGLILNFMPCVLPVLSLKLFSFIKISDKNSIEVRKFSLATIFGIIFSFVLLSLFIISFKFFGLELGWGFQFQNYNFLLVITIIILLFSLNLLGFFDIFLPNKFTKSIYRFIDDDSSKGYFFSGVFSTLMATPCSAPFLGTAVGFSITSSYENIFFIFVFISLGFSMPYIVFTIRPSLIKRFPKPGKWMINFKFLLGLILLITFSWFLTLLNIDKHIITILVFLVLLISTIINKSIFSKVSSSLILISILYIFLSPSLKKKNEIKWKEFDETILKEYINSEQLIFLDFTADWCVTCQLNKLTTLDSKKLQKYFNKNDVKLLRGDWGEKDEKILSFISKFERYGIPVNIIYGPGDKQGVLLPEILTKDIVINELNLIK